MIDDINIKEFLIVDSSLYVEQIMDHQFIALNVNRSQKDTIGIFRNHSRFALPVTDDNGVLLGLVTLDDVMRLAEKEDTKEIQKIGGSEALDEPYNTISFVSLIRKRAGWLIILFLGEMLTATAMGHFEGELSRAVVLAMFIPLIISSGGNSGISGFFHHHPCDGTRGGGFSRLVASHEKGDYFGLYSGCYLGNCWFSSNTFMAGA